MITFGIDPGLHGGWAMVEDGCIVDARPFETEMVHGFKMIRVWWDVWRDYSAPVIFIEEQGPQGYKTSRRSAFTIGGNFYLLLDALRHRDSIVVSPKVWQNVILPKKATQNEDTKSRAFRAIQGVKGAELLIRTKRGGKEYWHDGLVDAACIALYGEMVREKGGE